MRRNDLCEVSTETAWGYASDQNGFSGDVGSERSGDFLGSGRGTKGWVGCDRCGHGCAVGECNGEATLTSRPLLYTSRPETSNLHGTFDFQGVRRRPAELSGFELPTRSQSRSERFRSDCARSGRCSCTWITPY